MDTLSPAVHFFIQENALFLAKNYILRGKNYILRGDSKIKSLYYKELRFCTNFHTVQI